MTAGAATYEFTGDVALPAFGVSSPIAVTYAEPVGVAFAVAAPAGREPTWRKGVIR